MKDICKKLKAFTLAELMVVVIIIAIVATATIGIQKSKKDYVNKFMYYASLNNIKTTIAELIAEGITIITPRYVNCDPHAGDVCVPCNPSTDTPCVPCDPNDQGCDPCDYNSDKNCVPCNPVTQQFCQTQAFDGKYVNFAAAAAAFANWKQTATDFDQCTKSYDDGLGPDGLQQRADGSCLPIHNYPAAEIAYNHAISATETGVGGPSCTLASRSLNDGDYNDGDNSCQPACGGQVQQFKGSTGSTGWVPKSSSNQKSTTKNLPAKGVDLCISLTNKMNIVGNTDCNVTAASNFGTATPNFTTTNGMRWFNFGADPTYKGTIYPYIIGTGTDYANEVYTIYIDIDGKNKGKNTLDSDVMKFYITRDGIIFPAEDSTATNTKKYLSASVRYKVNGKYTWLVQGVNYKLAACSADGGTGKIIPLVFNYCNGVTPDTATFNTCKASNINCEVYNNKPGF